MVEHPVYRVRQYCAQSHDRITLPNRSATCDLQSHNQECTMKRRSISLASAIALIIVLWLIWSRLHIVLFVQMPWWGLLLLGVALFLALDHLIARLVR
jgi:hypothetical protein